MTPTPDTPEAVAERILKNWRPLGVHAAILAEIRPLCEQRDRLLADLEHVTRGCVRLNCFLSERRAFGDHTAPGRDVHDVAIEVMQRLFIERNESQACLDLAYRAWSEGEDLDDEQRERIRRALGEA